MNPPTDYLQDLIARIESADPRTAVELLAQAADAHPQDARPLLLLGAEFMQAGDTERAEAAYTAALQRAPAFAIARFQLGLLQFTSGRPAVALVTWTPLDALAPEDPLRLFKDAFVCLAADDFAGAGALLQRGIEHNASNAALNRDMRMVLEKVRQQLSPAGTAPPSEEEHPAEHFLVSAYTKPH